jgi:hypothetical protein
VAPELRAAVADFLLEPMQLEVAAADSSPLPLAIIDLEHWPEGLPFDVHLPFPVIGMGSREHPRAAALDTVIEPPVTAQQLIEQITAAPRAAAAIAHLLRSTQTLTPENALTVESFCYGMLQKSSEYLRWLQKRGPASASRPGTLRIERHEGVLQVILNRPDVANAIDREMRDQLHEAFVVAAADPDIRVVQVRAAGKVFCAGGDLNEFSADVDPSTAHLIRCRTLPMRALIRCAHKVDVQIHGACIGAGLELAACAARVTAAPDAWFQLPEIQMGLLPGAGGCVSVPRRIGRQRAALMMLSGQKIDAATALRWGLVDALEGLS